MEIKKSNDGAKQIDPPERKRIYYFSTAFGEYKIELENVIELKISASGNHRIKTQDGKHHIIPTGWLHIELDIDNWNF